MAARTGGRALLEANEVGPGLDAVFLETSGYYFLGYETPVARDGRYHRLQVRVDVPGAVVQHRSVYKSERPATDLPLHAGAATFAGTGNAGTAVAIALGIRLPATPSGPTSEDLDVQTRVR